MVCGQESYRILRRSWLQSTRRARALVCRRWPTPSLADATADVVDSSSLRFLAASALEARRKEEEEERDRRIKETEQLLAVPRALPDTGAEAQN